MRRFIIIVFSLIMVASLSACQAHSRTEQPKQQFIIAEKKPFIQHLYFSGTIKPTQIVNVVSPVDGIIDNKFFNYGQYIHRGAKLLAINSHQYVNNYQQAFVNYLKAKDEYARERNQFAGTEQLWKDELVSQNDYNNAKSQLANSYLSLLLAQANLKNLLRKDEKIDDSLSVTDTEAIKARFKNPNTAIEINSSAEGIILFPVKSNDSNETNLVEVGSQIKSGQILMSIGNLNSIAIDVDVSEMDVLKLKPGQKVTITGVAFNQNLQGQISHVGEQAKKGNSGNSLPLFPVQIIVPNLTEAQKQSIRVGMSAKVNLELQEQAHIMLPLNAIMQNKGNTAVKIWNEQHHMCQLVPVVTGKTSLDEVVILSGIAVGTKVCVDAD